MYWIFGRSKFQGYSEAIRRVFRQHQDLVHYAYDEILEFKVELPANLTTIEKLAGRISDLPFTKFAVYHTVQVIDKEQEKTSFCKFV